MRYTNRDPEGRYTLTKEIICDPHHSVILQHVQLEGDADLLPRLKVYALLAPHLDGGGAGNSARAVDIAGHKALLAWKNEWSLAMGANCGFSKVSCGFVGPSDGWRDLMNNFRMDWEYGSALNGNIAIMGELDLQGERPNSRWRSGLAKGIIRRRRRRWGRWRIRLRRAGRGTSRSGSGRRIRSGWRPRQAMAAS